MKVQPRKAGNFIVTLPSEVAALKLDNERVKVLFDKEKKRVIYQF